MAVSSTVVTGDNILASQYNNLRTDVLDSATGHRHNGTDGRLIQLTGANIGVTGVLAAANGGTALSSIGSINQVLGVNGGATGLEYKTVAGTANQITVTHAANSITLSFPSAVTISDLTCSNDVKITAAKKLFLDGGNGTYIVESSDNVIDTYCDAYLMTRTTITGFAITATTKLYLDGGGDTYIYESSANRILFYCGGSAGLQVDTGSVAIQATQKLYFDGGGDTYIAETFANNIYFYTGGIQVLRMDSSQDCTFAGGISIPSGDHLALDGGGNTYIKEETADNLSFYTNANKAFFITETGNIGIGATARIYFDGGGNTYIAETVGDQIEVYCGGASSLAIQSGGIAIPATSKLRLDGSFSGDTYIYESSADDLYFYIGGSPILRLNMSASAAMYISGTVILSGGLYPNSAGTYSQGDGSRYWNDINYKTLVDRGCLGWFDDGVELQDGSKVSDMEAIRRIKKHATKKTVYDAPMLDYTSFPKVSYKPADVKGVLLPRDKNNEPIGGADGIEMTSFISIMIGAIKELDARLLVLEPKNL